jgi:uncharacterized membrane protein
MGRAFRVSLLLKGADAVLEIVGGALLLVVSPASVNRFVAWLTLHELSRDPNDFLAGHLREAAAHFAVSRWFGAAYLLSHGLAKIVLVFEIFRGRLWAYPGMLVLLALFVVYQTYRLMLGFTIGMFALTVFDIVVIVLTWREYKQQRAHLRG